MEQNIVETPHLLNAWAWAEKNRKQILIGAGVAAVVGLALGYAAWARGVKEEAAGQALSTALYNASGQRTEAGEAGAALLKVAADNRGTQAGTQALFLAGGALFNAGKYSEAQATFERFAREQASHPLVATALYGAGTALAAQEGKLPEAAQAYKSVVDRFPKSPIAPQARYSLAGIWAAQNNLEPAVALYEEVARGAAGNSLGNEAALRADELRAKLPPPPAVATPAPTSTNAPAAQP